MAASSNGRSGVAAEGERVRELLHRRASARDRYRAAVARLLEVTDTDADALAQLAGNGSLTPSELSRALDLSGAGTSHLIARLERAGHLTRQAHPRDGRSVILQVSATTAARLQECYAPLASDTDELIGRFSPYERELIVKFLSAIVALSERHAEQMLSEVDADAEGDTTVPIYM